MLVWIGLNLPLLLAFLLGRLRAAHTQLGEVALRLHRALMDSTVLQAQAQHGRRRLLAVEDAFDLAVQLEEVVLAQTHLPVLNLHRFLDALLQIDDNLVGSFGLNVLVNIAVRADSLEIGVVVASLKVHTLRQN